MKLNKDRNNAPKKYESFGEYIRNDREKVMPFLVSLSIYFSAILWSLSFVISMILNWHILSQIILGIFAILSLIKLYKFVKAGRGKALVGTAAKDIIDIGGKKNE